MITIIDVTINHKNTEIHETTTFSGPNEAREKYCLTENVNKRLRNRQIIVLTVIKQIYNNITTNKLI